MKEFERYGNILFDTNNRIIDFQEKQYTSNGNINGGIYLITKKMLNDIDITKFSFEKDFMELKVKETILLFWLQWIFYRYMNSLMLL